ncbi:30S ribosomal protein S7 [Chlamydiota bacterium]
MSRRHVAVKRKKEPDTKYNSILVAKLVNRLMYQGKKSKAEKIIYNTMEEISSKIKAGPIEILTKAIDNVKPLVEVKSRRVGGATYQVPVEVSPDRQITLALRWILGFARDRKGTSMKDALIAEIMDAYNKQGSAMKKREDTHKMAEANKAFSHYRW